MIQPHAFYFSCMILPFSNNDGSYHGRLWDAGALGFDRESVACVCVSNAGEEKRMTAGFIKVALLSPT
jgi:hypothetical protein